MYHWYKSVHDEQNRHEQRSEHQSDALSISKG